MRIAIFSTLIVLIVAMVMASSTRKSVITNSATNGPFRDGVYVGKLAASRGDHPRIAYARWANASDRASFATGYQLGYAQQIAALRDSNGGQQRALATLASYQDGLYLGRLDASQGKSQHVATGRWSGAEDRASFASGYLRGYEGASELAGGDPQASLGNVRPTTH